MSVRTKMNGGKQINLEHQCMAAGLRLTLEPTWTADSRKQFLGSYSGEKPLQTNVNENIKKTQVRKPNLKSVTILENHQQTMTMDHKPPNHLRPMRN